MRRGGCDGCSAKCERVTLCYGWIIGLDWIEHWIGLDCRGKMRWIMRLCDWEGDLGFQLGVLSL